MGALPDRGRFTTAWGARQVVGRPGVGRFSRTRGKFPRTAPLRRTCSRSEAASSVRFLAIRDRTPSSRRKLPGKCSHRLANISHEGVRVVFCGTVSLEKGVDAELASTKTAGASRELGEGPGSQRRRGSKEQHRLFSHRAAARRLTREPASRGKSPISAESFDRLLAKSQDYGFFDRFLWRRNCFEEEREMACGSRHCWSSFSSAAWRRPAAARHPPSRRRPARRRSHLPARRSMEMAALRPSRYRWQLAVRGAPHQVVDGSLSRRVEVVTGRAPSRTRYP